jgi:SNF2 family DNA or RNA helicase
MNIISQQNITRNGLPDNDGLLVVDEAHKARESTSGLLAALKNSQAQKRLLLTASPVYNHPADIAPLINLASNEKLLPESRSGFERAFVRYKKEPLSFIDKMKGLSHGVTPILKKHPRLLDAIDKYVDYEPSQKTNDFPSSKEEVVRIPLHKDQQDLYNTMMSEAPSWVSDKVLAGIAPSKSELAQLNAFLNGARQISNSTRNFVLDQSQSQSPKLEAAVNYLHNAQKANPDHKSVVYSNYLDSGLNPYKELLERKNIPYGEFSGGITQAARNQLIRDYNENKLKTLLISSAGGEGLDLKGTRLLQILEPHFNREKEKQVIGRAIRFQSHSDLPLNQRNVLIQRYIAHPTPSWLDKIRGTVPKGTDEYISDMADRKEKLNQQLMLWISKAQKKNYGK